MRSPAAIRGVLVVAAVSALLAACAAPQAPAGIADLGATSSTTPATATPPVPASASATATPVPTLSPSTTLPADVVTDIAGEVAYTHPATWVDGPESSGTNYMRHSWNSAKGTYVEVTGFAGQPTLDPEDTSQAYVDASFGTASTVTAEGTTVLATSADGYPAAVTRFTVDYNDGGPLDVFCVGAVAGDGFGFLYVESSADETFTCDVAVAVLATVARG